MRKSLSILLVLSMLAAATLAQKADRDAELRSLVEAERAFAATSVAKGTRAAFLENLNDDSILFNPGPVNGRKLWSERPVRPGVLTWQPIFADVAQAGDLGYTTGPWEFREKSLEDKPIAHGQFMTIWKRQADGVWKVALDLGTQNPPPETPAPALQFPSGNQNYKKLKTNIEAERMALLKTDSELSKTVAAKKTVDAFLSYMADDVRFMRTNAFPVVGKKATRAALMAKPGTLSWQATKADVSSSGDLGYIYGTYEFKTGDGKTGESGNYVRIWKRQAGGKWKIVLDLLNPIPPAPKN